MNAKLVGVAVLLLLPGRALLHAQNGNPPVDAQPQASTTADSSLPAAPEARQHLRVSQGVMQANLIYRVDPVYPAEAKQQHIAGDVLLRVLVGKDGSVHNIAVVAGPKELIDASVAAVEKWRYKPLKLKGEPVDVESVIKIQFRL